MASDRGGPDRGVLEEGGGPATGGPLQEAPAVAGFDIVGWNRPADESGGDFFDFQPMPSGGLAITVADVSGRGVGAVRAVGECRGLLRAALAQTEEPARVVARVNRLLCRGGSPDRFITAFVALLDRAANRLTYVSAGHGPVWFYSRALGDFRELEVQGYPLALEADEAFATPGTVAFAPGDFLAIVTDGFFEWVDARGECFGIERLQEQIRRDRDRPAAEIILGLHREVLAFAGAVPQPDDLTAVIIKRLP